MTRLLCDVSFLHESHVPVSEPRHSSQSQAPGYYLRGPPHVLPSDSRIISQDNRVRRAEYVLRQPVQVTTNWRYSRFATGRFEDNFLTHG